MGALGLSDRQKFQPVCPSVGDRHNVEQSARFGSKADFAVAADYVRQGVRKSPGMRNSMAPIAGVRGAWTCSLPTQELRKIPQVAQQSRQVCILRADVGRLTGEFFRDQSREPRMRPESLA